MLRITDKLKNRLRKLSKALIDASMEAEDIRDEINESLNNFEVDDSTPQGQEQLKVADMLSSLECVLEKISDETNELDSELIFEDAYNYTPPKKKKKERRRKAVARNRKK